MAQLYVQFRIWFFDTVSLFFIFYPAARGRGAPKDHHSKIFKIHISQKFPWVVFLNRHRSLGFILNLTTSGPFHGPLDNKRASILSFILRGPHNPWRLFKNLAGKLNKNDLRPMADQFGGNVTKTCGSVPQLFLAFSQFRPRFPAF